MRKKITIKYNGIGKISARIDFKNYFLILNSLENLKIYKKNNRKKVFKNYNEFKINNFKPGVLNLVKNIIKKDKSFARLPDISEMINLYKVIKFLPY